MSAFGEFGDLFVVGRPGDRSAGEAAAAIAERVGDCPEAFELDSHVPVRDQTFLLGRRSEHRRVGAEGFEVGGDAVVLGQAGAVVELQDRHGAARVDLPEVVLQLGLGGEVDFEGLDFESLFCDRIRARRGLGAVWQS